MIVVQYQQLYICNLLQDCLIAMKDSHTGSTYTFHQSLPEARLENARHIYPYQPLGA